jgi:hypothetical protein
VTITVGVALSLAACANDGLLGSGATTPTAALPAAKPVVDPACTSLASQIDALRREGVVERAEAAAKGKGMTVNVKRESLGKLAQLEKANAEFQAKCSTVPRATTAAAAPAATAKTTTANVGAAAATAKTAAASAGAAAAAAKTSTAAVKAAPTGAAAAAAGAAATTTKQP